MPDTDNRFSTLGVDARFPFPGTDTRFPSVGTDTRFPSPGLDTRFTEFASPSALAAFLDWTRGYGVIASGAWDDTYLWSNAEVWNDAVPFAVATGTWNRRGVWLNAATWNDGDTP